ncbi:MAG: hypothetical protein RID11_06410 [Roseovarius sp.]|uniref:hypothetical protein n=1 Tax=Roseovarius sp. TaxID=1486281 RepID=UPI0032EDC411
MKHVFALTTALALLAPPATAAGMSDPVVSPEIVAAEATSSSVQNQDIAFFTLYTVLVILTAAGALN